jgi:hypothetical protein
MKNHGSTEDDDDEKKTSAEEASPTEVLKDANIKEEDAAEEFSSDVPSMAELWAPSDSSPFDSSQSPPASKVNDDDGRKVAFGIVSDTKKLEHAPTGEPPYASLPSASKVNDNDDRNDAHGGAIGTKILEHAPPSESMPSPGLQMGDLLERPAVVYASNHDVAPGAFHVPSTGNTATSRTSRSPSSYESIRELTHEESKQEEGLPNSPATGAHDSSRPTAETGFYAVEAQRVPDGNDERKLMVAEAQYVRMKWYQRPLFWWIFVCGLVGALVVLVVLVVGSPPSSTPLTPEQIACNFLSIGNATMCRSKVAFDTYNEDDTTTGSSIPSEIGLLIQLTELAFYDNALTSTIPSEIGLLTQLTVLSFFNNTLTSSIPSEIGLLTQLTVLDFSSTTLTSTIPSEIGLLSQLINMYIFNTNLRGVIPSSLCALPSLKEYIFIDCGEITCDSGCCSDYGSGSSCN